MPIQGLYSLSGKTSYRQVPKPRDWKSLNSTLAVRDFTRYCCKTSYRLVNRGPDEKGNIHGSYTRWINSKFKIMFKITVTMHMANSKYYTRFYQTADYFCLFCKSLHLVFWAVDGVFLIYITGLLWINSLRPSEAYVPLWTGLSLV